MSNLQQFKDLLLEAVKRGGLTVGLGEKDFLKIKNFKSGYMVGGFSSEYKKPLHEIKNIEAGGLYFIMIEIHRQAAQAAGFASWEHTSGLHLGFWIDEKRNMFYMEVSKRFTSKKAALKAAAARRQVAVYDLKNNESIYL